MIDEATQKLMRLVDRAGIVFKRALYQDDRGGIKGDSLHEMNAFLEDETVKYVMGQYRDEPFIDTPKVKSEPLHHLHGDSPTLFGSDRDIVPAHGAATHMAFEAADKICAERGLRAIVLVYDKDGNLDAASPSGLLTVALIGLLSKALTRLGMYEYMNKLNEID